MKIFQSNLIFTIIFCSTVFNPTTHAKDQQQKTQQLVVDSEFNRVLDSGLKQLNRFEHTLEHLALLVYSESSKFTDKDVIMNYIKETREIINNVRSSSFLVPQLGTTIVVQAINNALSANLESSISSNSWKALDLGSVIKRGQEQQLDISDIERQQYINQAKLEGLETTIERFGLTNAQKIIRKLEDGHSKVKFYIEKHKLEPYIKYSAWATAALTYAAYQSDKLPHFDFLDKIGISKLWNNSAWKSFKGFLGTSPNYDKTKPLTKDSNSGYLLEAKERFIEANYKYELSNSDKLGLLGNADYWLNQNVGTGLEPTAFLPGATFGWLTHKSVDDFKVLLAALPVALKPSKITNMLFASYFMFYVKNSKHFGEFRADTKAKISKYYEKLRGKSHKDELAQKPKMTFNDVIGLDYAKQEFETVIDYIINPDKYERTKLAPAKGYLMVGPPRTGKSYIAKAICGEINERQKLLGKPKTTNFIPLDADLVSDKSFYKIMEYINSKAPCIVFIDEIDLLCLNRGDGNKENKLLSQILTHMSGYVNEPGKESNGSNKQVIFVAATNNPHSLDSALLQPGRFGKIIAFEYPHLEERTEYIKHELEKRCISSLDIEFIKSLSRELEGYTFEDVYLVITSAIQRASSEYKPVGREHFRVAMEESLKTIIPYKTKPISDQELNLISSYMAGKALVTRLLDQETHISTLTTMPVNTKIESQKDSKIITTPTLQYGGIFTYKNSSLLNLKDEKQLRVDCKALLAGHIAQELTLGSCFYSYRAEDQQTASQIAKEIALQGERYEDLTEDLQQKVLEQTYQIKKECKAEVKDLLSNNLGKLKDLTDSLKENGQLYEDAIEKITG